MIKRLIISLFLTIIIELITSFLLGVKKNTKIIICANICTNPIVVYKSNTKNDSEENNKIKK